MFKQFRLYKLLTVLLVLSFVLLPSWAGAKQELVPSVVVLGETVRHKNISADVYWYADGSDELEVSDIMALDLAHDFNALAESSPGLGFSNVNYWAATQVRVESSNHTWLLEHHFTNTHSIDLYVVNASGEVIKTVKTGVHKPFITRDLLQRKLVFSLPLQLGETYTLYRHIRTQAMPRLNASIWEESTYLSRNTTSERVLGIVVGVFLVGILLAFLLFVTLPTYEHAAVFSFFVFYSWAYLLYEGLVQTVMPSALLSIRVFDVPFLFSVALFSLVQYWVLSLKASVDGTWVHRLNVFSWYWLLLPVGALLLNYRPALLLVLASFFASSIFISVITIRCWQHFERPTKTMLAGTLIFSFVTVIFVINIASVSSDITGVNASLNLGGVAFIGFMFVYVMQRLRFYMSAGKKMSKDYSATKTRLQAVLTQTQQMTALLSLDGKILEVNDGAMLRGLEQEVGVIGKFLWDMDVLSGLDDLKQQLMDAIARAGTDRVSSVEWSVPKSLIKQVDARCLDMRFSVFSENEVSTKLIVAEFRDVTEIRKNQRTLYDVALGVAESSGAQFFQSMVAQLAKLTEANAVFIGAVQGEDVRRVGFWSDASIAELPSYKVWGSPFDCVKKKQPRHISEGALRHHPGNELLEHLRCDAYLSIPLTTAGGDILGVLTLFSRGGCDLLASQDVLKIFVSRAQVELERERTYESLRASKKRLSIHALNTNLAFIELDSELCITGWNAAAQHTFGFDKEEAIGQNVIGFIMPGAEEIYDDLWQSIMANRNGQYSRIENITKNKKRIICDWYNTLLIDDDSEILGVGSLIVDVTSEVHVSEELARKELEQREVLNSMVDAVVTINESGEIESCNRAAEGLFGYIREELLGKNISVLMYDVDAKNQAKYISRFIEIGVGKMIGMGREVQAKTKNGYIMPIRLSLAELPSDSGRKRFIASCSDLTLVKKQEKQLRRSQKMDALGNLTGGIAHDFNNLLGVVMGYADLLNKRLEDNPTLKKYSEEIYNASERGARLTRKLLAFSKQAEPSVAEVDINELLADSKNMLERVLTARIQVEYILSGHVYKTKIDIGEFQDALVNLAINSMHAMDGVGVLTIGTSNASVGPEESLLLGVSVGDYICVSVGDTGSGIAPDIQERVFDPFFSTKDEKGTGLGLSQVYGFVERNGGVIKLDSEGGKGALFTLFFPRNFSSDDVSSDIGDTPNELRGNETILLVDDEPAMLEVTSEMLGSYGYQVTSVSSASEALAQLKEMNYDLLLSDVILPEIDGNSLAEEVRKRYPNVKIQLASGFVDNNNLDQADNEMHRDGEFHVLQKPFNSSELLARIRTLLDAKS